MSAPRDEMQEQLRQDHDEAASLSPQQQTRLAELNAELEQIDAQLKQQSGNSAWGATATLGTFVLAGPLAFVPLVATLANASDRPTLEARRKEISDQILGINGMRPPEHKETVTEAFKLGNASHAGKTFASKTINAGKGLLGTGMTMFKKEKPSDEQQPPAQGMSMGTPQ